MSKTPELIKIVLVTGASSGIGKQTAYKFAKHGYDVIITGRRQAKLDEIKVHLEDKYSVNVISLCFDIRDYKQTENAFKSLPAKFKKIDVLVNNAGLARGLHPIHEGRLSDWEEMIDTNIKGLLYITRLVTPGMVKRGHGHVINVCSTAGHDAYPNGNVYSATKFAVKALTKSMHIDLFKHGIRVSQVSPGHVEETEFALVRFDGDDQKSRIYDDFTPLKAKDVAEIIYFMASRAKHINIQEILVMSSQQAGSNFLDRSGRK